MTHFFEIKHYLKTGEHLPAPTLEERINVCLKHLEFSIKWKGNHGGIVEMRRHYANYFKGIPHFKEYRAGLVMANERKEVEELLAKIKSTFSGFQFV